jgi:hypothetical protein
MKDQLVDIWRSRFGRLLFFLHLITGVALVGYVWNTGPQAFHNVWFLFVRDYLLTFDAPQIIVLHWFKNTEHTKSSDAVFMFMLSLPWWGYGYVAEQAARRYGVFKWLFEDEEGPELRRLHRTTPSVPTNYIETATSPS